MMPSRLGRAGRALRTTWTYWPDKGRRHHQIAYAVLHPHLIAYGLWLWATLRPHQEQPMTTVQLALCDPTWIDPEPDDDNEPWCSYLDLDLGGQGANPYRLATMTTLTVSREYL